MVRFAHSALAWAGGAGLATLLVIWPLPPAAAQDAGQQWDAAMRAGGQAYGTAQIELALQSYAAALEIAEANFAEDDTRLFSTLLKYAPAIRADGRSAEAAAMMERGIALEIALWGDENGNLMTQLPVLAAMYADLEQFDKAVDLLRRTIGLMTTYLGEFEPRTVTLKEYLAKTLHDAGRTDEALELFGEVVLEWELAVGPNHVRQSMSYERYAQMLEQAGRTEEAQAAVQRSNEIGAAWQARR